jgi:hypothetical protein
MDRETAQESSERDQLWASLRQLRPAVEALANGQFSGSEQDCQIVRVLARIILAELNYRARSEA